MKLKGLWKINMRNRLIGCLHSGMISALNKASKTSPLFTTNVPSPGMFRSRFIRTAGIVTPFIGEVGNILSKTLKEVK